MRHLVFADTRFEMHGWTDIWTHAQMGKGNSIVQLSLRRATINDNIFSKMLLIGWPFLYFGDAVPVPADYGN